jgi:Helicase conserved C-terminal domain
MGWTICRIDGKTKPLDRREEMNRFQTGGDDPDAPRLFLLSTRAGGLGINLVAADTVIFYDQDWVNEFQPSDQISSLLTILTFCFRILKWMLKHKTERIVLAKLVQCLFSGLSVHTLSKLRSCSVRRRSASWRFSLLRKVIIVSKSFFELN